MEKINELLLERKYEEAILLIKEKINDDPENPDLWYSLFLAENGNYIDTDYSYINNELAFNKALELDKKKIFYVEYNFYKAISKLGLHRLFRCAQINNIKDIKLYLDDIKDMNYEFSKEELCVICDQIHYLSVKNEHLFLIDVCVVLLNIIYVIKKSNIVKVGLDEMIALCQKHKTLFKEYVILNNLNFLKKKLRITYDYYFMVNSKFRLIDAMMEMDAEIQLLDSKWEIALRNVKGFTSINSLLIKFLAENEYNCEEQILEKLALIDFSKDETFMGSYKGAKDNLHYNEKYYGEILKRYDRYIAHSKKCVQYLSAIKNYDNFNNYKYLKSIGNFYEASIYVFKYENKYYQLGLGLISQGNYLEAIANLEKLDGYKDSKTLINNCKTKLAELEAKKKKRNKIIGIGIILVIAIIVLAIIFLGGK